MSGSPGAERDTLRLNLGTEPPSLDWHVSTDSTSFDVVCNLMIGLTQYRNDLSCAPGCASSWEILDNGKRYVFHLKPDVKWSDGRPLVAGDFIYGWLRLLDPKTAAGYGYFLYDIVGAKDFNSGKIKDPSKVGIKALDDHTLEVTLLRPAAYFIYLTAFAPTYPMRKDIVEKYGDRWTEPGNLVCNGPFLLDKWQHEYKIELVANRLFTDGEPKLKRIKMFMVPEPSTAFALYENDELDYIDNRSFATPDVERSRKSPEYHNFPLLRNNYIGFNCTKKPFTDPRVRRAVSMSIDRDVFPQILRRGEKPSYTWIPPGLAGYSPGDGVKYDPVAARKLLTEAGYPDGKGLPPVDFLYPNREDIRTVVEAVQDQLKRNLGLQLQLQNLEWKVYLQTLRRDAPPIFRNNWGADYPDPETFANLFTSTSGNNVLSFKNAEFDKLVVKASAEQDKAKRAELYSKADRLLCVEQAALAPVYLATQNMMVKPWVRGIATNPLDLQFFKNVVIEDRTKK